MATKAQAQARADELGVMLGDDGTKAYIEAPDGMQLTAYGLEYVDVYYNSPPGAWKKADVWQFLIEEMEMGIEPRDNLSQY